LGTIAKDVAGFEIATNHAAPMQHFKPDKRMPNGSIHNPQRHRTAPRKIGDRPVAALCYDVDVIA
jgi:hypothetical protein